MGELMFTKGSAEQCAMHCDELAKALEEEAVKMQSLMEVSGFGGFQSGTELETGFRGKANDAMAAVRAHAASARQLAENFRAAERSFQDSDDNTAAATDELKSILESNQTLRSAKR